MPSLLEIILAFSVVALLASQVLWFLSVKMYKGLWHRTDESFTAYSKESKALHQNMLTGVTELRDRLELTVCERDRLSKLLEQQHSAMIETSACMHASIQALGNLGYSIDFAPAAEGLMVNLRPMNEELADVHFRSQPPH